ncbi:hypothetical protein CRUP_013545 [Coryphaenoides rupestris]|nr:hypothetical protein CRUP_013545 [Coryphaenoides rupestris]
MAGPGDVAVSVIVLAAVVLLSEATRRLLNRSTAHAQYAVEFVSTLQLCCCTHELRLLAEGGVAPLLSVALTYLACVVHALTFGGALGNACGALERVCSGRLAAGCALRRLACQLAATCVARALLMPRVWARGLSDLHVRHAQLGFRCVSQIRAPLPHAAAVELAGTFCLQSALSRTHALEEKYRVHAIATVVTTLVYAGTHTHTYTPPPATNTHTHTHLNQSVFSGYSFC